LLKVAFLALKIQFICGIISKYGERKFAIFEKSKNKRQNLLPFEQVES